MWPPHSKDEGVGSLRDAEVKHAGSYSGRLRIANDAFENIVTWHHSAVRVHAGQEIVLSLWIKAADVGKRRGVDVQLRQSTPQIVGSRATAMWTGTFDWKRVVHRFTIPEGADHFCVVPLLEGKGTVWLDDVVAYGVPTTSPSVVEEAPRIDGKLVEPCWDEAKALSDFVLADGAGLPQRKTSAWAVCDPESLYFAFRCEKLPGDRLRKTVAEHDGKVWGDDDVELFLNLQGDWGAYHQFMVNPLGTKYESRGVDPGWDAEWEAATQETTDEWTVEIAIPAKELPLDLTAGQDWCVNFYRSDKVGNEASAWSCPFGGFHMPGRLGRLTGVALDFVPFYVADAGARIREVRKAYDGAMAGLDLGSAPATIVASVSERGPRIRQTLSELDGLLKSPATTTAEQ